MPFVNAQKYGFSLEAGQQFGINGKKENDASFPSARKYSLGSGVNRQFMFHVYPDSSNWFFSAGLSLLTGNQVITAQRGSSETMDYQALASSVNALRLMSRVSYLYTLNKYSFTFSAGLILPVLSRTREEYHARDSFETSITTSKVKNYLSLGFNGCIGVSRQITPRIRCFLNSDVIILNHQVKSREVLKYENSRGATMETAYPNQASRETVYHRDVTQIRNNPDVLPQLFNKNQATDKLSYRVTDSSIGLQVGFLFLF